MVHRALLAERDALDRAADALTASLVTAWPEIPPAAVWGIACEPLTEAALNVHRAVTKNPYPGLTCVGYAREQSSKESHAQHRLCRARGRYGVVVIVVAVAVVLVVLLVTVSIRGRQSEGHSRVGRLARLAQSCPGQRVKREPSLLLLSPQG